MDQPGALAVLADGTRRRIVELIRDADEQRMLVGRLAEVLSLRQPTVSHHMRVLTEAGLVSRHPEGRRVWYALADARADEIGAVLGPLRTGEAGVDVERITRDLVRRFEGVVAEDEVARVVEDTLGRLAAAGGPLLASRTASFAASRLDDLVGASRLPESAAAPVDSPSSGDGERPPSVLFVCVQNAGRSQLAAGIMRHLAGSRVRVRTAGSAPAGEVRGAVVAALDEVGVSLDGEFPKPLTDDAVLAADVVVTMGCGDACPVYPGRRYVDWPIEDPVGKPMPVVRSIRDDIDARVRELLVNILPDGRK